MRATFSEEEIASIKIIFVSEYSPSPNYTYLESAFNDIIVQSGTDSLTSYLGMVYNSVMVVDKSGTLVLRKTGLYFSDTEPDDKDLLLDTISSALAGN